MKSILLILLMGVSLVNFAGQNEKEPVLIKKIRTWTTSNLFYPEKALKDKIQGTVYVSFKITEDLKVTEIMIEEGVSEALDQKAIEVLTDLAIDENQFTIGKKYILPVKFVIN